MLKYILLNKKQSTIMITLYGKNTLITTKQTRCSLGRFSLALPSTNSMQKISINKLMRILFNYSNHWSLSSHFILFLLNSNKSNRSIPNFSRPTSFWQLLRILFNYSNHWSAYKRISLSWLSTLLNFHQKVTSILFPLQQCTLVTFYSSFH